jgi:hypothetical protein
METCCICFDDDENLITPKHCSCKIKLHEKCLILLKDNGMLCPICKVNNYIVYPIERRRHFRHIFQRNGSIWERIIETPLSLFENYPNVITFIILFICSILFCFFVLLPVFCINYFLNTSLFGKILILIILISIYIGYASYNALINLWNI